MRKYGHIVKAVCFAAIMIILSVSLACFASAERVIVAIDAGHGGHDGGTDIGLRNEKEYNLIVAQYLSEYLSADENFEVVMTRTDDTYMKFLPRVMIASDHNADIIVSLHFNSNGASYVNGSMAFCSVVDKFDAGNLANRLLDAISDAVAIKRGKVDYVEDTGDSLGVYYWNNEKQWDMPGAWNLGQKSDYYSINTWASKFGIPSIIVEHGYLSNPAEAALIDKDETLRAMAKAQAEAIISFYTDHEHNYVHSTDFPSNCTVSGTASSRCTVCGLKSGTSPLPAASDAHYWRQVASAKTTCTTDGYIDYVCQISYNMNDKGYACDVHTYRETFPAAGHSYQVTVHTDASHGNDGVHTEVCQSCGDTKTTVTPGDPHVFEITESVAPTCTEDGRTVYTCSVCQMTKQDIHAAAGHDWAETNFVPHTDTEDGYYEYTCTVCSEVKHVSDLACRHDFTTVTTSPTCTESGKTVSTCSLCGYEAVEEAAALGHDYVIQMNTSADCTTDGFYKGKCSICGNVVTETTPAYGHSFVLINEELTHEHYSCETCGAEEIKEITPTAEKIFTKPVIIGIAAFVILQIAIAGILIFMHSKGKAEEERRKRRFADLYEEADETIKK